MFKPIHKASPVHHRAKPSRRAFFYQVSLVALLVLCLGTSFSAVVKATGERKPVVAHTAYVRDSQMRIIGTLRQNETFLIQRSARGGYVYGFAYGQVNKHGYIKREYLAP